MTTDERYWENYTAVQAGKHMLLQRYLQGWFPILGSFTGRILYIDTHAGRGSHAAGQAGSPIVSLEALLNHSLRDKILAACEVRFFFLEQDGEHAETLRGYVTNLGALPDNVYVDVIESDYEVELNQLLDELDHDGVQMAPSFMFIDPYGYSLSMDLLRRFADQERLEMMLNFMVRDVNRAVFNDLMSDNLDRLFGCDKWRDLRAIDRLAERHSAMIRLFAEQLGATYNSVLQMRDGKGVPKYDLIHASNHRRGRELMKDAMWYVTPNGSFVVYEAANPAQMALVVEDLDLYPLRARLLEEFSGQAVAYARLKSWLVDTMWRIPHLNEVLRALRNEEVVKASDYEGRFAFSSNPTFTFP